MLFYKFEAILKSKFRQYPFFYKNFTKIRRLLLYNQHKFHYEMLVTFNNKKIIRKIHLFADRNIDIVSESFPRSANTYAHHLFMYLNPSLKISRHTHSITNLKLSLKYNLPIVTIIRNPLDSIVSLMIRNNSKNIFRDLLEYYHEYFDFYLYVYKNRQKITIFSFEDFISNTKECLIHLTKKYKIFKNIDLEKLNLESVNNQIYNLMKDYFDTGSFEEKKRNILKKVLKIYLRKKYNKYLEDITRLYDVILSANSL